MLSIESDKPLTAHTHDALFLFFFFSILVGDLTFI